MILPPGKWATWDKVRARSLEIEREAMAFCRRECVIMPDPSAASSSFLDDEDAWLDDSAAVLGMTRSELEQHAAAGEVQWRVGYLRAYMVRHGENVKDMTIKTPNMK